MPYHELAQLNIATLLEPLDSPRLADFVANLERINALAEDSPGFLWRYQTAEGDATAVRPFGEEVIVNLTVWRDVESLMQFTYRSVHVEIMKRRREWFAREDRSTTVLWWVPKGHRPDFAEARTKLDSLRASGPTQDAFAFRKTFPPPHAAAASGSGETERVHP